MKPSSLSWALPVTAVVVLLSTGCAPSSPDDGAQPEASCAYVVEYDGRTYLGGTETSVPLGRPLGPATVPACDDTPGDGDGEGPVLTTAFAVRGVDPAVAVAVAEGTDAHRLVVASHVEDLPPGLRKPTGRP
ncbi:DUF6281 family protein [Streptomyces sp.]|uniref:DUF6281 family protein n=1 Tax=Streptomyces sp. TaxID=1931 RepID=UPI0028114773|nr:DUF6281 family protein [Streptomyces sp.]